MKLMYSPTSPFVRRVRAVALELGLADRGVIDVSQIALACCLGYADFRFSGFGWPARAPRVSAWYRVFLQRPSMSTTAPG
jgi:glutathione S-transferase